MSEWSVLATRLESWAIDLKRGKSISRARQDLEDAAAVIRYQEKLIKTATPTKEIANE